MVGEHGKKRYPGTDLIPVLLRHHARDLGEVSQVVYDPTRQQLPQRHTPQARVLPREVELPCGKPPGTEEIQIRSPQPSELGQERRQGPAGVARPVAETVVWLEAEIGSLRKDDAGPWDPVGFFPVDQMSDDIEGTEGVGTFRTSDPRLAEAVEQRAERVGHASEQRNRQLEIEMHGLILRTSR